MRSRAHKLLEHLRSNHSKPRSLKPMAFFWEWRSARFFLALMFLTQGCERESRSRHEQETVVLDSNAKEAAELRTALKAQRTLLAKLKMELRAEQERFECANSNGVITHLEELSTRQEQIIMNQERLIQEATIGQNPSNKQMNDDSSLNFVEQLILLEDEKRLVDELNSFGERQVAAAKCLDEKNNALVQLEININRRELEPRLSRESAQRAYQGLIATMKRKSIILSDLTPSMQNLLKLAGDLRNETLAPAISASETLQSQLNAISIDGQFIAAKNRRIQSLLRKCADPEKRISSDRILSGVARAVLDGRYDEANKELSRIMELFENPPNSCKPDVEPS